jgi:hypothetical protein
MGDAGRMFLYQNVENWHMAKNMAITFQVP